MCLHRMRPHSRHPAAYPIALPAKCCASPMVTASTCAAATGVNSRSACTASTPPERNQPYGREAGRALESLLKGKRIEVEVVEEDSYGRLVSVVYAEGRNINLAMVQGGHAWWYEFYAADKPELERAQREASSARLGLWGAAEKPVAPWDWRRRQR